MFVTNCKENVSRSKLVSDNVKLFHLNDLIQYLIDDIDMAMPRTPDLCLTGIGNFVTPGKIDSNISTSIVFARLIDFIQYMHADKFELLFARNVRLDLGNTPPNKAIRQTFEEHPEEFAFSNNGITIICEEAVPSLGTQELTLVNPRVVNGSQTLHQIKDVPNPSADARVLVRIVTIPLVSDTNLPDQVRKRKDIINKISIRSNLQNPIKKWNLVANDDFQIDLFRYFYRKGFFYERRPKE